MALSMNIKAEDNGQLTLSNDRTTISIRPDGTVVVSTKDPLQLSGETLSKFVVPCDVKPEDQERFITEFRKQLNKRT